MKLKRIIFNFLIIFIIGLIVAAFSTYFYNLFVHHTGQFSWGTAVRLAIILGIIYAWLEYRRNRFKQKEQD